MIEIKVSLRSKKGENLIYVEMKEENSSTKSVL